MHSYTHKHTWVKAAFHVLPNPVLYWANKLSRAHLSVNLSWGYKAHLGPVNININNGSCSVEGEGAIEISVREAFAQGQWYPHRQLTCLLIRSWISCMEKNETKQRDRSFEMIGYESDLRRSIVF